MNGRGEPRPRAIVSSTGINGTTTYLVGGSTSRLRNADRRRALARARAQLQQFATTIRPLTGAETAESLQLLFDWLNEECERLTAAAR
jgi:hypothetical protein